MVSIARKNLFQDKRRFLITISGIGASLILVFITMGVFTGSVDNSVTIIDHTHADIWVTQKGVSDLLGVGSVLPGNTLQPLDKIDGVQNYSKLIMSPLAIDVYGSQLKVMVYGYNLSTGVGGPWSMASGNIDDLRQNGTIIVDQSIEAKFGKQLTGDSISVGGIPQKVVGVSRDSKWFTFPVVFTSYENAQKLFGSSSVDPKITEDMANYALVNVKPNYDPLKVSKEISTMNGTDAFITSKIRDNTRHWLIFDSGAAMGLAIGAGVGWVIAAIIVTLTIYTVTIERIPEFGTLKAIGASKKDVYKILLEQVFVSVTLGYTIGVICSFIAAAAIVKSTLLPINIGSDTLILAFFLTLILSILGSLISARKVNKVDPAIVFRV